MTASIQVKNKIEQHKTLKVDYFKSTIRKTEPHKHEKYFEIIFLQQGNGTHYIDEMPYPVQPPVVFVVKKEEVHHFNLLTEPKGFVAIIKREYVEEVLDKSLEQLFSQLSTLSSVYLSESSALAQLFELLIAEMKPEPPVNKPAIEGLLKTILAKIIEQAAATEQPSTHPAGDLYLSFVNLLSQDIGSKKTVHHYAALLNTTPQNLNAICRKAVNKQASDVLAEYTIKEAQRLLMYTGNTIAEIAFLLEFKDASHFVKYFKRYTALTPRSYRQNKS